MVMGSETGALEAAAPANAAAKPDWQDLRISPKELRRLHALASGRDGGTLLGIAAANALLLHEIAYYLSTIHPNSGQGG
jgi:hypothetical protein